MKYRVFHVLPMFSPGGAERMAVHLLSNLDRQKFEIGAISLFNSLKSDLEDMMKDEDIPVFFLGKQVGFDITLFHKLNSIFEQVRPHIVHTHQHVLKYVAPVAEYGKIPAMVHTVHSIAEKEVGCIDRFIQHVAFRRKVVPVAISHEVALSIARVYKINKCPCIPNGIPVELYGSPKIDRHEWRKRHGFTASNVLFVCVANLRSPKNHGILLSSFGKVSAKHPGAHLLLVGDGNLKGNLQDIVMNAGMEKKVHFLGFRNDIPEILSSSDVFVLSSDWEGNPLAVMEAMAAGKPVISTAVGGIPELVEAGKEGILMSRKDEKGLADAMGCLFENADLRLRMGDLAAKKAQEKFDVRIMTDAYANVYENLLNDNLQWS